MAEGRAALRPPCAGYLLFKPASIRSACGTFATSRMCVEVDRGGQQMVPIANSSGEGQRVSLVAVSPEPACERLEAPTAVPGTGNECAHDRAYLISATMK